MTPEQQQFYMLFIGCFAQMLHDEGVVRDQAAQAVEVAASTLYSFFNPPPGIPSEADIASAEKILTAAFVRCYGPEQENEAHA